MTDLVRLFRAIGAGDQRAAHALLDGAPEFATEPLARPDEFFLDDCLAQLYEGDTALHVAACSYDLDLARELVARGAKVQARNRRGAEPLHAATNGVPGSAHWNPQRQRAVIVYLVGAGADPNAAAAGGVTPLHRAVRNRCAAAVAALLDAGADPNFANGRGSTAFDLVRHTTGRSGSGSAEAAAEQEIIVELLARVDAS